MKDAAVQTRVDRSHDTASNHPAAASAAPPGYGIDFLDRTQPNRTGLPDRLKAGVEALSGLSMDDVRVHYNSSKPMQLQALAYTQGTEIHVGPGEEKHLAHEAWHVVQQKEGRVKATNQAGCIAINDDADLEHEADRMGKEIVMKKPSPESSTPVRQANSSKFTDPIQMVKRNTKRVPPKLVHKQDFIPWCWTDNLKMSWGNWFVPDSSVHNGEVSHNQLYGGYTILFSNGFYKQRSSYGPYVPGTGKDNHVERKFWKAMEPQLETDIAADETEDEDALVVIDINQHHTPCSGPSGCTKYLNNKLKDLAEWDQTVAVGRFKASNRYDSSLSETHPLNPRLNGPSEVTEMEVDEEHELDKIVGKKSKSVAFHSFTVQDRK